MKKSKSKIYILPMLIIFIAIVVIYYGHYNNTMEIIQAEYDAKIRLVEQSMYNEIKYTEIISKLAERDLEPKMRELSYKLIDRYDKDPNILKWDLEKIKNQFDGEIDIHILDENLHIIASTNKSEVGLNFNDYPEFSKLLKKRLGGNEFESDSINFSILQGEVEKYSYMPTPDNKYLLEISISIKKIYPELANINVLYLLEDLKDKYPFVEDVKSYQFYDGQEHSSSFKLDDETVDNINQVEKTRNNKIKKAIQTGQVQSQTIKYKNGNIYTHKYIPYSKASERKKLNRWGLYITEAVYDDQVVLKDLNHQRKLYLKSILVISILYLIFSAIIASLINKNQRIAYEDYLTKLPNRKSFEELLEGKLSQAKKENKELALLYLDLDKFKEINDTYGHNIGDKVLQKAAKTIKKSVRKEDLVSRLGGDEFAVIMGGFSSENEIEETAKRILSLFNKKVIIDGISISMQISIGVSIYPSDGDTMDQLTIKADKAMYEAKEKQIGYKISDR